MAVASVESLSFTYPDARRPALDGVSLELEPGELVVCLGPSGSGKSTLLRALAGLVPHFHGGRFSGRVAVGGLDTRTHRPAALAGTVASVFQDPEDQVVLGRVLAEIAFGLENLGTPPRSIEPRARAALAAVGAAHLAERATADLSGGELQRVCLASALALEPRLLLLDEPTSQLDPDAAEEFLELVAGIGAAVVLSEQRPTRPLARADRVLFLDRGRLVLDAPREPALAWLAEHRPAYLPREESQVTGCYLDREGAQGEVVCRLAGAAYSYAPGRGGGPADLVLRRGEVVALVGPNGSGKTTLAKLAAGLLEPASGRVERVGRAAYLSQDPGRYLVRERADEEVALGAGGDLERARAALERAGLRGFEARHPRDLSSGERERLALACVLVTESDLLVLDEPTRGVDPERKDELAALLRRDALARATLVVTHDVDLAAAAADRVVSLAPEREAVPV